MTNDKVRENKVRRMAGRQGYQLMKSRRRDPNAWDYGLFTLIDAQTNGVASEHLIDLDGIEEQLSKLAPVRPDQV